MANYRQLPPANYPRQCPVCHQYEAGSPQGLGRHLSLAHATSIAEVEGRPIRASRGHKETSAPATQPARKIVGVSTVEAVRCDGCAKLELFDRDNFTWSRVVVSPPGFDDITLLFHSPACQRMNFNRRLDERMKKLADDAG